MNNNAVIFDGKIANVRNDCIVPTVGQSLSAPLDFLHQFGNV